MKSLLLTRRESILLGAGALVASAADLSPVEHKKKFYMCLTEDGRIEYGNVPEDCTYAFDGLTKANLSVRLSRTSIFYSDELVRFDTRTGLVEVRPSWSNEISPTGLEGTVAPQKNGNLVYNGPFGIGWAQHRPFGGLWSAGMLSPRMFQTSSLLGG